MKSPGNTTTRYCGLYFVLLARTVRSLFPASGPIFDTLESVSLTIAAIRSGTEPLGKLPAGAFHRWLDDPINCPKCSVSYNLVVPWDDAVDRFFPEASRPLLLLLHKAVFLGHGNNHRVSHFETSGVVVRSIMAAP